MKITNGKDFWAGLMFIGFGLGFMAVANNYAMGTAVRMGPAYFPTVLGGMLAVLGAAIFLRAFMSKIPHPLQVFPFRLWFVVGGLVLGVIAYYTQVPRDGGEVAKIAHELLAGVSIGLLFAAFGPRSLWVILFSVVVFGYLLKPLGLVLATGVLIFGSAWGGHEFKTREVTFLFVGTGGFLGLRLRQGTGAADEYLAGLLGVAAMEALFTNLGLGFSVALSFQNLFYCFMGVVLGTLIGVLPGIGPVATIAMLLPVTFTLNPTSALIMLAGIYYGAQYGGSTTAILVNLPGESSSVVTCLDGYQMARQGRAGAALGVAALGSFFAGCVATIIIALFAPPLAEVALKFGPAEYFSLMVLGLIAATVLAHGSLIKAIAMVILGLLLGLVGTDVNSGVARFAFGVSELSDGIGFVSVAMGVFGFAEIIGNLEQKGEREIFVKKVTGLLPTWQDIKDCTPSVLRGTALGSFLGILPGGGALLASFAAYTLEKKVSKNSANFGKGAIQGVAAPESANNAGAQTSFIPLLTLGIPSNPVMALMIGAMMIQGIAPGPQVMTERPQLFWGMIASMWVGNLMLVVLNLPLIGMWIKLLQVPYRMLYPAILLFCCVGVYSLSNSPFDVMQTAVFGVVGYIWVKLECEPAPLILGFILGPLMEENLRRAMLLSRGDALVFFQRPISLTMLLIAGFLLVIVLAPTIRKKRDEAFVEA